MLRDLWKAAPAVGAQKPWEGAGVTAAWPSAMSGGPLAIASADRYWSYDFKTGTFAAASGLLKDAWAMAPAVDGQKPWEGPGVTAVYWTYAAGATTGTATVISRSRYWHIVDGMFSGSGGDLSVAWKTVPSLPSCP